MKKCFLSFLTFCLVLSVSSCFVETQPFTSEKRTDELLDIHSSISPQIPFDMNTSKIIMFSDLHRGMGKNDVFINNKELYRQILNYYNDNGYTLVLIGDVEEGWGFQRDNIPNILDVHAQEFEIERKFQEGNRYYRVYGNHDDFFRGNLIDMGSQLLERVFPALIFTDQANNFKIFITHGCQGQGLHDAGDNVASWGVYVKYNWWLEIFPKKLKSEQELIDKMDKVEADLEKHEEMLYQWALNKKDASTGKKIYNILVAGHTHIPVFNSIPNDSLYNTVQEDIESGKYIFFNDVFENQQPDTYKNGHRFRLPQSLKDKLKQKLAAKKNMIKEFKEKAAAAQRDPFYFNTGCGFHSKMTCIEINGGKIYLKLLGFDSKGNIDFNSYVDVAELKNY